MSELERDLKTLCGATSYRFRDIYTPSPKIQHYSTHKYMGTLGGSQTFEKVEIIVLTKPHWDIENTSKLLKIMFPGNKNISSIVQGCIMWKKRPSQ